LWWMTGRTKRGVPLVVAPDIGPFPREVPYITCVGLRRPLLNCRIGLTCRNGESAQCGCAMALWQVVGLDQSIAEVTTGSKLDGENGPTEWGQAATWPN